jgi:hypothetical protein
MKAEGIEYEERMELLEDVTYPRPLEDLLQHAYDSYRTGHPWVADHELKPKSVARDMSERAMTFTEYVGFYNLARSEGIVLRYLADAYKALRQTVPQDALREDLEDIIAWLGETVRQTDSSLLDEWEQLVDPAEPDAPQQVDAAPPPLTANTRAFTVLVRNAMFRRVELAALRRWDELGELDAESGWDADRWREAMGEYYDEHQDVGTGPHARGPQLLQVAKHPTLWSVRQVLDDPAADHDWGIEAEVDLPASDAAGVAVVTVTAVRRL